MDKNAPITTEPAVKEPTAEELCGSTNILDTVHLKNLVDDLSKLYGTSVCTKVAKDAKVAAEKRLIEAIRANLNRYNGYVKNSRGQLSNELPSLLL